MWSVKESSLLLVFLLAGCVSTQTLPQENLSRAEEVRQRLAEDYAAKVGVYCADDRDCETPVYYAIRSNCPFGAACVNNSCMVVCPLWHTPGNESVSYLVPCGKDSDCDCSGYLANDSEKCACLNGRCMTIIKNQDPGELA